ncbi:hypothetical protein SVIO_018240 [Streptomyces violaceusniger]|uniref:Uncharacterized protein n=1 Tax=Streptomyces violaceusniger TaxID=68280 RepID=A0A4D4KPE1_STRVO|nr:hypothetical protein SVIO_018240 [Streptomyces violaceusniger]
MGPGVLGVFEQPHGGALAEDRVAPPVVAGDFPRVPGEPGTGRGELLDRAAQQGPGAARPVQPQRVPQGQQSGGPAPAIVVLGPLSRCQMADCPAAQFITVLGKRAGSTR